MNFEEALKKVKAGTATDEERAFVEARMTEARSALKSKKPLDFDEALAHVQDGTATDEERQYVERQLDDATATLAGGTDTSEKSPESAPEERDETALVSDEETELAEEQKYDAADGSATIDFEAALDHVQQGTATEQEKLYVRSQIAAANAFFSNDFKRSGAPIKEASGADVKRAKKSFKTRYIFIPVCVVLVVILAVGAILGGVFGYAATSAKQNMKYSAEQCKQLAIDYIVQHQDILIAEPTTVFDANDLYVEHGDVDRHFHYNGNRLAASYYTYEIEVKGTLVFANGYPHHTQLEIEVKAVVNTMTGNVDIIDRDIDWD